MLRSPATTNDFSFDFIERKFSWKFAEEGSFEFKKLDVSRLYPQEEQNLDPSIYSFPHLGQNIIISYFICTIF
jgi:hypothetical protein